MLAQSLGWPLAMIEGIEAAGQFDLTLNDIDQLCDAMAVSPFELLVPQGQR